mgnify:CR=1 FL=1
MRAIIGSVGTLLISAALLLAGGGLMATLIAVRAQIEGFPIEAIGLMTSAYFAGFISGCFGTPYLVKRVGHVRVFAALSAMIAAAALTHAIFINIPVWITLRVLVGFSFAGLYLLIESWINEQAPNEQRGQVLSLYRMVDLGAITAGQFMLTLADPGLFILFSLIAILICVAIFPISLSTASSPQPVTQTSLNLKKLYKNSPLAVIGSFGVGLAGGSFWGVAPVFVQQLGHPVLIVSIFMSVVIAAGAMLQWPAGFISDKVGRRQVLLFSSIGAMFSGLFLWQFAPNSLSLLLVGGGLYGMFAMQIYGMSAAHANDYAEPGDFVAISGGLLLIYGLGSVVGPSLAPLVMKAFGPSALFAFTASVHGVLSVYVAMRIVKRKAPEMTTDYVNIPRPRSMNLILRMDPRILKKRKKK